MSRPYSPKRFLRQAPNSLLAQYFNKKELLIDIEFEELKETQIDRIFDAWRLLPGNVSKEIEKEFRDIDFMATEGGVKAIIELARYHDEILGPVLSPMEGHHKKVFWFFLNRQEYWKRALLFYKTDKISWNSWYGRNSVPKKPVLVDHKHLKRFESAISNLFYQRQGRGQNCTVEYYKRYDRDYFFCYPENYAQSFIEWIEKKLERLPHTPAFEVIFVFNKKNGTLDIHLKGGKKPVPDLQKIFADIILETKLGPDDEDQKVYDLKPLKNRNFQFRFDIASGIIDVRIKKLVLSDRFGSKGHITIKNDPTSNRFAVHDMIENRFKNPKKYLESINISKAEITVYFSPTIDLPKGKIRSFKISYPNYCNLNQDEKDLIIRQMLSDSGIEPRIMKESIDEPLDEQNTDEFITSVASKCSD